MKNKVTITIDHTDDFVKAILDHLQKRILDLTEENTRLRAAIFERDEPCSKD